MEQLIHWIDSDCTPMDCVMKAKELLKIEKEQIKIAFATGDIFGDDFFDGINDIAENYYNETYGK